MRRLLTGPAEYLSESVHAWCGWNAFFFRPADPTAIGLIRVVVGALLVWNLASSASITCVFGSDGWTSPAVAQEFLKVRAPLSWSFWYWVPDGGGSGRSGWSGMGVFVLFTLGLWSRVTAVLVLIIRGLDDAAAHRGAVRDGPDAHGLDVLSGRHGGRAVRRCRSIGSWRHWEVRGGGALAGGRPLAGAVGSARAFGVGEPVSC